MSGEPASPVCYLAGVDDSYAGFVGSGEIVTTLTQTATTLATIARAAHSLLAQAPDSMLKARVRHTRDTVLRRNLSVRRILGELASAPPRAKASGSPAGIAVDESLGSRLVMIDQAVAAQADQLAQLAARIRDDALCQAVLAIARSLREAAGP